MKRLSFQPIFSFCLLREYVWQMGTSPYNIRKMQWRIQDFFMGGQGASLEGGGGAGPMAQPSVDGN